MNMNILPHGSAPEAITPDHFPAIFQAVIFRNWNIVPVKRIASALNSDISEVMLHAEKMGLNTPPSNSDIWLKRGYVSIIRTNWHLLDYEGILKLLEWTPEKLFDVLQNEDFLWTKLGGLKPECPPLHCRPLSDEEEKATAKIAEIVKKYPHSDHDEQPFSFVSKFSAAKKQAETENSGNLYIAYSYSALYGDPLTMTELDPYPDELLQALAAKGINGIWIPGILYQLHYWQDAPQLSQNHELRIKNLNKLIAKAAKYGMKVFMYLNEPRGLSSQMFPVNSSVHTKYLEVESIEKNVFSMCTSKPAVLQYLANGIKELFSSAPGLGGAFMITQSENITHCGSRFSPWLTPPCPRCGSRPRTDIVTEILKTIADAAHSVSPEAEIICWDWGWDKNWIKDIADKLPSHTSIMTVSENMVPVEFGGIKTEVADYSLSHPGPGEKARYIWQTAEKYGLKNFAKIQISTTWECSAVPYIPVTKLLDEHLQKLRDTGIKNFVTNWTLGGYPSINMDLLQMSHPEMVRKNFGEKAEKNITLALENFSEAFRNFPFDVGVIYKSPHNIGPANPLYHKPTGYNATMVGMPYDDISKWVGPYTAEIYCECMQKLCRRWEKGLQYLQAAENDIESDFKANYHDLLSVSEACYCSFASALNQARYVNELRGSDKVIKIQELLNDEIKLAAKLLDLARKDSRLGFEATNHYAYTHNELLEKIINCEYIKSI